MIDFGYGVNLKTISPEILPQLRSWRNDYRVWRWCRQNDLISYSDHLNWFDSISNDKTVRMYLVSDATSHVGVCGLTSIDMLNRRAEFSLYIDPDQQRRGHGEKALKTLLKHGFLNLGLNSIWGETFAGNPALEMFEKIGMKKEGTRREFYFRNGRFVDCHLVSILGREFLDGNPTPSGHTASAPTLISSSSIEAIGGWVICKKKAQGQ